MEGFMKMVHQWRLYIYIVSRHELWMKRKAGYNRGNQTRYVTVVTKHLFFVMHRPRSDGTRNYNRYMTKL